MAFQTFKIRQQPEVLGWFGRDYPACYALTLVCSRGLRWDGGEYATRAEAIAAGERKASA